MRLAHSRQKICFLVITCGKTSGDAREGRERVYRQPSGGGGGVYRQPRAGFGGGNASFSFPTSFLTWSLGP